MVCLLALLFCFVGFLRLIYVFERQSDRVKRGKGTESREQVMLNLPALLALVFIFYVYVSLFFFLRTIGFLILPTRDGYVLQK